MQRESLKYYDTRQESRQGGKKGRGRGARKNATASVESQRRSKFFYFSYIINKKKTNR